MLSRPQPHCGWLIDTQPQPPKVNVPFARNKFGVCISALIFVFTAIKETSVPKRGPCAKV
jgi:hypothetical protein